MNKKSVMLWILFLELSAIVATPAVAKDYRGLVGKNGIVAYTWNSNPSAKHAILSTSSYTFNYGRSVDRKRLSAGVYQVMFEGLSCNRGQFTVNAYGGTEFKTCRIGSWNGKQNCDVSVYCFNANGAPMDSQFNLLFID